MYRVYITDALRGIGKGSYMEMRYYDLINPAEDFDAESVIDGVISRAGLEVTE